MPIYERLLGNRDMLDEHPRKDDVSLRAIRGMKSFWSAGQECYDWVEETFLRKYEDWGDDEGLFFGLYKDDTIDETDQSTIMK
jgi:hypothetical protein